MSNATSDHKTESLSTLTGSPSSLVSKQMNSAFLLIVILRCAYTGRRRHEHRRAGIERGREDVCLRQHCKCRLINAFLQLIKNRTGSGTRLLAEAWPIFYATAASWTSANISEGLLAWAFRVCKRWTLPFSILINTSCIRSFVSIIRSWACRISRWKCSSKDAG